MNTLFKLNNYVILDLYELELEASEGYLRFHGSKNFSKNLFFQNQEYTFIPCELSNLQTSSDGKQSKPVLKIANINNYISYILKDRNNLIGKNFIRKKILAKDLDLSNFTDGINPYGVSSFKTYITYDNFLINLKKSENKEFVEIELATKIDIQNLNIPARKVTNDTCSWGYRCFGCNYGNTADYLGPSIAAGNNPDFIFPSSWWFLNVWGGGYDIGVPIADENDKVFLKDYKPVLQNENYGLTRLYYRGRWNNNAVYNKGDFVYLDFIPTISTNDRNESILSSSNKPKLFFVCINDNIINKQPNLNTDVWKQDQCSKTFRGCLLRFQDYAAPRLNGTTSKKEMPFGGFPGTFSNENKQ